MDASFRYWALAIVRDSSQDDTADDLEPHPHAMRDY